MLLCRICNSANGSAFTAGECHICSGRAEQTEAMIEKAVALLSAEKAKSFSMSTNIPKDWLTNEEDVWDISIREARSIKDFLNKAISTHLQKKTGLGYESDGDCRVVFEYSSGDVRLERNQLFVFGRYKKLSAGLSQSRWLCAKCEGRGCERCGGKGRNYESVEERIGEPFKAAGDAEGYVLHASGREDVDATNTAGRPFILEIKNPRKRRLDFAAILEEISKSGEVTVEDPAVVGRAFVEVVTESHFDKSYEADVEFGRELTKEDLQKIESLRGRSIAQQTPKRVAHRRADIVRHRRVKEAKIAKAGGNKATITITAEAGTYIKELISGDGGRTNPSMAELLGTKAECKKLNVSWIDDGFLDFCLETEK